MVSKPRRKHRRTPRPSLLWPNTGSTSTFRLAYSARPAGGRPFAAMCSVAVIGGSLPSPSGAWWR